MTDQLSFIEVQFPVSKISKGKLQGTQGGTEPNPYWLRQMVGQKAFGVGEGYHLGLLMPASKDPIKDREIFLKILMMDAEGLWARKNKPMKIDVIIENLTYKN